MRSSFYIPRLPRAYDHGAGSGHRVRQLRRISVRVLSRGCRRAGGERICILHRRRRHLRARRLSRRQTDDGDRRVYHLFIADRRFGVPAVRRQARSVPERGKTAPPGKRRPRLRHGRHFRRIRLELCAHGQRAAVCGSAGACAVFPVSGALSGGAARPSACARGTRPRRPFQAALFGRGRIRFQVAPRTAAGKPQGGGGTPCGRAATRSSATASLALCARACHFIRRQTCLRIYERIRAECEQFRFFCVRLVQRAHGRRRFVFAALFVAFVVLVGGARGQQLYAEPHFRRKFVLQPPRPQRNIGGTVPELFPQRTHAFERGA